MTFRLTMPTPVSSLSGQVVPFPNSFSYYLAILTCIFVILAVFANGLVIYKNSTSPEASTIIVLSVCVSDFLLSLACSYFIPGNVINGGWFSGQIGCFITYSFAMTSSCASIMSLCAMSLERYLAVCKGIFISKKTALLWLAFIWAFSILSPLMPYYQGDYMQTISLQTNTWACVLNWHHKGAIPLTLITVVGSSIFCTTILYSYACIYLQYRRAAKKSSREEITQLQRKVLTRCVILTLTVLTLWTPEIGGIAYEIISGNPLSAEYSSFSNATIMFNTLVNPILLIILDPKIRKTVGMMDDAFATIRKRTLSGSQKTVVLSKPNPTNTQKIVMKVPTTKAPAQNDTIQIN